MFSKITKLNDYDKVTLIYEPTVQARQQKSKLFTYLIIILLVAVFLLGVNFAFHFLRYNQLLPPSPSNRINNLDSKEKQTTIYPPSCSKTEFDYLVLAIRWPPSFCNYAHCRTGVKMYSWDIHGLWPDYNNGKYPQFCCSDYKFNFNELKPIASELENIWQDLTTNETEHSLWTHEWDKHGTCTLGYPNLGSIFKYFNTTMTLFKKYHVQTWLEEENILPTHHKSYKLSNILNTIESRLGKRIKIECDKYIHEKENCDNADYSQGSAKNCKKIKSKVFKLLDTIYLCFDKNTLNPIDCPIANNKLYRTDTCDNDVYYFRLKDDLESLKF